MARMICPAFGPIAASVASREAFLIPRAHRSERDSSEKVPGAGVR